MHGTHAWGAGACFEVVRLINAARAAARQPNFEHSHKALVGFNLDVLPVVEPYFLTEGMAACASAMLWPRGDELIELPEAGQARGLVCVDMGNEATEGACLPQCTA